VKVKAVWEFADGERLNSLFLTSLGENLRLSGVAYSGW